MEKRFGITILLMPKAYLFLYLFDKFPVEQTKDTKNNLDQKLLHIGFERFTLMFSALK